MFITRIHGNPKSLICVKSKRFLLRFSTSETTATTSGKSLSFLFNKSSITTLSSNEEAFKL